MFWFYLAMKITNSIQFDLKTNKKESFKKTPKNEFKNINLNSCPSANLNRLMISFGAMKKTQFEGIDLMMINQLQAPIQKFNTNQDFQEYCMNILNEKYFSNKSIMKLTDSYDNQAASQKETILKEWIHYITIENEAYTPAMQLMIMSSITKNLKYDTNHLPPILDKRKLADTIQEIVDNCATKRNYNCNFDKLYRNNLLSATFQSETQLDESLNGWVMIPSKENDSENFEENVKKLQILSHDSWCTKTYNAKPYLAAGDFHIYFEKGRAKLGLRFCDGMLAEIQGEKNDGNVPHLYFEKVKKYISENNFKVAKTTQEKIDYAKAQKEFYDLIGEEAIKNKDLALILPHYGVSFEQDENGMLILDSFYGKDSFKSRPLLLEEIGISYNDILAKTIRIKGHFKSLYNECISTGSVEEIGGSFYDNFSRIETLGKIKKIANTLNADCAFDLKSLGDLKYVGGNIKLPYFKDFKDEILKLEYIGGFLKFQDKFFAQPNLLLQTTPLTRPITYEEYENWEVDAKKLTPEDVQRKINEASVDDIFSSIFGNDWFN